MKKKLLRKKNISREIHRFKENTEICFKNTEICIKKTAICIKNTEICIKNTKKCNEKI